MISAYNDTVVVANMITLSGFKRGDKPLFYPESGEIKKDERSMQYLLRKAFGGFDTECINQTLQQAVEILRTACEDKIEKGSSAEKIYKVFLKTLGGVRNIAETYRDEKKTDIADKLDKIAENYSKYYRLIPDIEKLLLKKTGSKRKKKAAKALSHPKEAPTITTSSEMTSLADIKRSFKKNNKTEDSLEESFSETTHFPSAGKKATVSTLHERKTSKVKSEKKNEKKGYQEQIDNDKKTERKTPWHKGALSCCGFF